MDYRRHFAVIGAVAVIAFQGFDFFVQNLVTYPIQSWPDKSLSAPFPSGIEETFIEWNNNDTMADGQLPTSLQIARIANATNYSTTDIGHEPCKFLKLSGIQYQKVDFSSVRIIRLTFLRLQR